MRINNTVNRARPMRWETCAWLRTGVTATPPTTRGDTRGWLLGHFIDPAEGVRSTEDVEVKWGVHPSGDKRPEWTADDQRTTLLLLVQGRFRIDLTEGSTVLDAQGDYVLWGPGIDHSWLALADSVIVTVRWPSKP